MTTQAWTVDLSRRQDQMQFGNSQAVTDAGRSATDRMPANFSGSSSATEVQPKESNIFERVFDTVTPTQEIVVLNSEQGFVPSTIRVKEGVQYKIIVVNVNEKARNVSFVMDAFSEHHATFYGQIKSFYIHPKKEGVYTFISPETSAQGRLVVHPASAPGTTAPSLAPGIGISTPSVRAPAAE
jgi:plastocyanin domain-containing protein